MVGQQSINGHGQSVVNLGGQEKGDIPSDSLKGQKWWSMYQRFMLLIKGILGEDCKAEDIRVDSLCFGARSFEFAVNTSFLPFVCPISSGCCN